VAGGQLIAAASDILFINCRAYLADAVPFVVDARGIQTTGTTHAATPCTATTLEAGGAPGWSADQWVGYFVECTNGIQGVGAISTNDADTLTITSWSGGTPGLSVGFRIVDYNCHRPRITACSAFSCTAPSAIQILCGGQQGTAASQRPNGGVIVSNTFGGNTFTGYVISFDRDTATTAGASAGENIMRGVKNWNIAGNVFTDLTRGGILIRGSTFNIAGNLFDGGSVASADDEITGYSTTGIRMPS
jgi:hypothetical protein